MAGSKLRPVSELSIALPEMPCAAASCLKPWSHVPKSPPQGAAAKAGVKAPADVTPYIDNSYITTPAPAAS